MSSTQNESCKPCKKVAFIVLILLVILGVFFMVRTVKPLVRISLIVMMLGIVIVTACISQDK